MNCWERVIPCCLLLLAVGCGGKPASFWAQQARDHDPSKRLQAIHALQAKTSDRQAVTTALVEALRDEDAYVRRDAARALGQFGPVVRDTAAPPLVALLKDPEPSVRKAAGVALAKIDDSGEAVSQQTR